MCQIRPGERQSEAAAAAEKDKEILYLEYGIRLMRLTWSSGFVGRLPPVQFNGLRRANDSICRLLGNVH